MNPELIRIATENKAIVDAFKAQMVAKNKAVANTSPSNKSNGIVWKTMLFAGVVIVGYNVYNHYLNKQKKNDYLN
jgi:hypothetical protein